jgi:hypothetical protein
MRHLKAAGIAIMAALFATGSLYADFMPGIGQSQSSRVVAALPTDERNLMHRIDVADCRDGTVAGLEPVLYASEWREERRELARAPELVARFCECRFEASSQLLTKSELVSRWLTASAMTGGRPPGGETKAGSRVTRLVRDCAETSGLRTLPDDQAQG